ncbi:MAG: PilZ domain-containing protein [Novosphingobium sp.]|uniref:PilZ domain-containing protein n=1 Tax=Novosphingobium sp. TaxID=1874826 RepID=UPI0032BEF0D8
MDNSEHRQIARDSLFVMADLRIDGIEGEQRVRVRNLSSGGMMAECTTIVQRGQLAWTNLRNIGWVEGSVAWVQEGRFGVAFREEIDPIVVRAPAVPGETTPRFVRPPLATGGAGALRKI